MRHYTADFRKKDYFGYYILKKANIVSKQAIENKQEIIVTEAMIEAGVQAFSVFAVGTDPSDEPEGVVERVYLAMAEAQAL